MITNKNIVVFDIQTSCEDKNINPYYNIEIIKIHAIKIANREIVDSFETFIKPEYTDKLTDYCIELTGITFDDLETAPKFTVAILEFYKFIYGCEIYSCGEFDKRLLVNELNEKGYREEHELTRNFIEASYTNLKSYYNKITGNKKVGVVDMANALEVKLTGDHYKATSDAETLGKIFLAIEEIRANRLSETFDSKTMFKLIDGLNKNHNRISVVKDEKSYYLLNLKSGTFIKFDLVGLLDTLKDLIMIDIEIKGLSYIDIQALNTLKKYGK